MGVSTEPGQKGVNWSNIAVGEYRHYCDLGVTEYPFRWHHEYGARHKNSFELTTHFRFTS